MSSTCEREFVVRSELGLHARPAGRFVQPLRQERLRIVRLVDRLPHLLLQVRQPLALLAQFLGRPLAVVPIGERPRRSFTFAVLALAAAALPLRLRLPRFFLARIVTCLLCGPFLGCVL